MQKCTTSKKLCNVKKTIFIKNCNLKIIFPRQPFIINKLYTFTIKNL